MTGGGGSPTLNLELFWFGDDDGTNESDNTFLGAKNSNQTLPADVNYRFRVSVSNTGTKSASGLQLQLEYNYDGGGWNPVNASSSIVRMSASTKLTEGSSCSERLAGAQTFDTTNAGQEDNDGLTATNNLSNGEEQEADYCFQIRSGDVAAGKNIVLRVTNAGTPLDNYNQTPTVTIAAGAITIPLDIQTLASSVIDLSVTPGAISALLDILSLVSSVIDLTVTAPLPTTTVPLDILTLASSPIDFSVVPGNASVLIDILSLIGTHVDLSVVPGATSAVLDILSIIANTVDLSVVPGAVSVPLDIASLTSALLDLTVTPGAVQIVLDIITLASTPIDLSVNIGSGAQIVSLDILTLASSLVDLNISPGAVQAILDILSLAANTIDLSVDLGSGPKTVPLDILTLANSVVDLTVSPGAVAINLDIQSLTTSIIDSEVASGTLILLDSLLLSSSLFDITILPGEVVVSLNNLILSSSPLDISAITASAQIVSLNVLDLNSSISHLKAAGYIKNHNKEDHIVGHWKPVPPLMRRVLLRGIMPDIQDDEEVELINVIRLLSMVKITPFAIEVDETKSVSNYKARLISLVRSLYNSSDVGAFASGMTEAITDNLTQAWEFGAKQCGIAPDELTPEELAELQSIINNSLAYIDSLAEAILTGKLSGKTADDFMYRIDMWANRWNEAYNQARTMACGDKKLVWVLGDTDHCFPKDTMIEIEKGKQKPIQDIIKGDLVMTTHGLRKVTRVHKNLYRGNLVKIKSKDNQLICTSNHPILTKNGWKRAESLEILDQVVMRENISNFFKRHFTFPNSFNNIATGGQVFVLSHVAPSLLNLAFDKRFKSRMTMPIIPISLYNKFSYFSINSKIFLDNSIWFKVCFKLFQISKKFYFKFSWSKFRASLSHFRKVGFLFFGMTFPILFNFSFNFLPFHRIILFHIIFSTFMYCSIINLRRKFYPHSVSNILNIFSADIKYFCGLIWSFLSKVFSNIFLKFFPIFKVNSSRFICTFFGAKLFSSINSLANRIKHSVTNWTRNVKNSYSAFISAFWGTKVVNTSRTWIYNSYKSIITIFTSKRNFFRQFFATHNDIPLLHLNNVELSTLYNRNIIVYNLSIEEVENYVANGFVVHNCNDCLKLEGKVKRASVWEASGIRPQSHALECRGYNCQCSLEETNEPLSRGPLPGISGLSFAQVLGNIAGAAATGFVAGATATVVLLDGEEE
jgi:hypothetical protein